MSTSVDLAKLNKYLAGKIHSCSFCQKSGTFSVLPNLMELREFQEGNIVIGGSSQLIPLAVLTCSNCGHTELINAIQAGLVNSSASNDIKEG